MQVDDTAAADFHGREGVGFDPAANNIFRDLVEAHHFGQDLLRAERRVAKIGYALGISCKRKPHYTRLFHVNAPIIRSKAPFPGAESGLPGSVIFTLGVNITPKIHWSKFYAY